MLSFEWDDDKNKINKVKHGVSFEEAKTVFYDDDALLEYDASHSGSEERFRILGRSENGRILLVVHCLRSGNVIRIISSRKATKKEKDNYRRYIG